MTVSKVWQDYHRLLAAVTCIVGSVFGLTLLKPFLLYIETSQLSLLQLSNLRPRPCRIPLV